MSRDFPVTDDERRWISAWKDLGGDQHGPNVEHVTIQYEKFFLFCAQIEDGVRARCHAIADEYPEWTYRGRYDNLAAASMASVEIAKAIGLGRPLTSDEIAALGPKPKKEKQA